MKDETVTLPTKLIRKFESALLNIEEQKIEWVDADEARKILGRGKEIKKTTFSNYVSNGRVPASFYKTGVNGKRWFNKQKLMGL